MPKVALNPDPNRALTDKESRFVDEYIATSGNQTVAYLRAYDINCDRVIAANEGKEILKRPAVARELQARIKPYRDSLAEEERLCRDTLYAIINSPNSSANDKCRAIDILNRMACRYVNRTINESEDNPLSTVDTATIAKLLEA